MNAPARAIELLEPKVELIPLTSITPSETHIQALRRARFSKDALAQLADSIRTVGVLQPVVVRPLAALRGLAKYELVAGERRWLAAKQAGLAHISASVRPLTEEEVLEVQLIENLQREGLHELEEAEGYEALMKLKKINADQVAEMVGKSRSYVYARTKLLALCAEARKSFYAGELDASRALLIARIGHQDTQRQALKDLTQGVDRWGPKEPMSYREAHKHILQNYMLQLKSAPFDIKDATLVAKAGSCVECPKRTGNQRDLFGDVKSADVCTDPKCFDDKRAAHHLVGVRDAEAKGRKVVYGDEAKKAFPQWDSDYSHQRDGLSDRYVPINGDTYVGHSRVSVRKLLGDDYQPLLIQHPGSGKMIEVATQQAVQAAANSGKKKGKAAAAYNYDAAERRNKAKGPDVDEMLTERLAKLVHEKAPKDFGRAWLLALAKEVRGQLSLRDDDAVAKAWGWTANSFSRGYNRTFPADAAKLTERDLVLFMFHLIFAVGPYTREGVLKLFGIDEQQVREQIIAERKAARSAASEKKAPAAAAKAPAKKKAKAKKFARTPAGRRARLKAKGKKK